MTEKEKDIFCAGMIIGIILCGICVLSVHYLFAP